MPEISRSNGWWLDLNFIKKKNGNVLKLRYDHIISLIKLSKNGINSK